MYSINTSKSCKSKPAYHITSGFIRNTVDKYCTYFDKSFKGYDEKNDVSTFKNIFRYGLIKEYLKMCIKENKDAKHNVKIKKVPVYELGSHINVINHYFIVIDNQYIFDFFDKCTILNFIRHNDGNGVIIDEFNTHLNLENIFFLASNYILQHEYKLFSNNCKHFADWIKLKIQEYDCTLISNIKSL